jgi:hypothetical protein
LCYLSLSNLESSAGPACAATCVDSITQIVKELFFSLLASRLLCGEGGRQTYETVDSVVKLFLLVCFFFLSKPSSQASSSLSTASRSQISDSSRSRSPHLTLGGFSLTISHAGSLSKNIAEFTFSFSGSGWRQRRRRRHIEEHRPHTQTLAASGGYS